MDCIACKSKATHECSCVTPALSFCIACLQSHVISTLSFQHNIQELSKTIINPLCSECKAKLCEVICSCKRIGLCKSCLVYHISSPDSHFIDYIRIERQSKDTFDIEKKNGPDSIKNEVIENIRHLEEFKQRIINGKDAIIEAVKKAADDLLSRAETTKKKMESAVDMIKTSKVPKEDQWPYNFKRRQGSMTPSRRNIATTEIKLCETELNVDSILKSVSNFGKVILFGDVNTTLENNLYYFKAKAREMFCIEVNSFYVVKKLFPKVLNLPEAGS